MKLLMLILIACTSVYRDSSGSTQSPGFPLGYPDSALCTYEFFGVDGKYIHFYFEEFDLEEMQRYGMYGALSIYIVYRKVCSNLYVLLFYTLSINEHSLATTLSLTLNSWQL